MRTFSEHKGASLKHILGRSGGTIYGAAPELQAQARDASYAAHLGQDFVKVSETHTEPRVVTPASLSIEELQDAVTVLGAQKARLEQLQKQTVQDERDRIAALQTLASEQLPAVLKGLQKLAEQCPYFAGVLSVASDRAQDRANEVRSQRVNARDYDFSAPYSPGHIPHSLEITLGDVEIELNRRLSAQRAEDARFKAMLERAGVGL